VFSLYRPLSIPSSVPLKRRLGVVVATIMMGYPAFAYVARTTLLESLKAFGTIEDVVRACVANEALALSITIALNTVNTAPAFLLQVACSGTSLSGGPASAIGTVISIIFSQVLMYCGMRLIRARWIVCRSIPEEYARLVE
jgi:hypothetical protein